MLETEVSPRAQATSRTALPGIAMIAVTFGLARYGYGLLLPEMQSDLRLTSTAAGLISSGTYVSYLVANVAVVPLTSRFGPRASIASATATAALGMTVIATAGGPASLATGVLVAGAAAGLAFPPYADLVALRVEASRRDFVWSAISSGTGWGVAVAGPIAIGAGHEWRAAWLVFVAVTVGAGVLAASRAPARGSDATRRLRLHWTWFFCPKSRPLLVSSVLLGIGSSVWWAFSVDAMRADGLGSTAARTVYAVCGVASIIASFSGAAFVRTGLRVGYLASCVLLAASLAFLGLGADDLTLALVAAVLFGIFYCSVIAAGGIWSSRVFADHPAAGLAAYECALTVGTSSAPPSLAPLSSTWATR